MRSPGVAAILLACLALAACTSNSGLDGLAPRPSGEVTSSIPPEASAPPEDVAAAEPAQPVATEAVAYEPPLAEEDMPPPAERTDLAAVAPAHQTEADVQLSQAVEPPAEAIALVAPARLTKADKAFVGAVQPRRFRDAKPINFGKSAPRHLPVHGVDVSRWQGEIDWAKLRSQGANFAYIKATDGGDHLDPMFRKNWRGAAAAGLKRGAYHFFYWCRTAGEQADWFIRNVPRVADALPPVIDVEWNGESSCKRRPSRAKVLEKMQVFMDKLEAHYGQRPIIYTAPDFYRDNLKGAFPNHPFWLRAVAQHPSKVYPGRKWVFWQYSGSGLSHGVRGRIDLNVFNGSEKQWRAWAGGQSLVAAAD